MSAEIVISVQWKLFGQPTWQQSHFAPELFFDLDQGEKPEVDSVPKRNHAVEYLDIDPRKVQHTVLTVANTQTGRKRAISETFWNEGKNRIIETTETGGAQPNSELIVESKVNVNPPVTEIVRAQKEQGIWVLAYHVFIMTNPDGSEIEKKVYPPE